MIQDKNEFEGFIPRQDRALIKVDDVMEKTAGGLIIPAFDADGKGTSMAEKPNRGTVLAIGPKVIDLKVGDRVLYGQHSGFTVKHNGLEFRLIRADDAFAQIKSVEKLAQ